MNEIPLFIMEEHNEAFYYWGYLIEHGIIEKEDNALFHIDHHDDLEGGGYFHDFTKTFQSLEERAEFTYEKLGIADFIIPALYEGIFSEFYNMKLTMPREFVSQQRLIRRKGTSVLEMGNYVPFLHSQYRKEQSDEYRFFDYLEGSLCNVKIEKDIVLDIDMDYFCWDNSLSTVPEKTMEITEQAYTEWKEDPYHSFRILPRRFFSVKEKDGAYYLCYKEPPVFQKEHTTAAIDKRMARFEEWLSNQEWTPKVITLCRSAISGYLPSDYSQYVEEQLLECLERIYSIKKEKIERKS